MPGSTDWAYTPGVAVWRYSRTDDRWVKQLAWCPEVSDAVRYPSQDGRTITRSFKVTVAGQTEVIPAGDLLRGVAWPKFALASGFTGRAVSETLVNIVTDQASRLPDIIGYPHFRDGLLRLPPAEYLPDGYGTGEGSTLAALTALVSGVAPYPVASLLMGLSASAPWVGALKLQPFTIHIVGDTTTGKTTAVTAASALYGRGHKGVTRIWSGTAIGAQGAFRDLGVLPVFRDELGTMKATGADRANMFSTIMEGCYRTARTRDDLPRPSASWASACFSTGNISAVPPSHMSAGTPKGVIEIHADGARPAIPPGVKARVQALTNDPAVEGAWIPYAVKLPLETVRAEVERAGRDLGDPSADGLQWHMWRAMSLALAGARILADLTGVAELAASAGLAARGVVEDAETRMVEIGADHGARLVDTVAELFDAHPSAFGRGETSDRIEQIGFVARAEDGTELVCVYPNRHAEIARRAEVEDVLTALRQLRESGHLLTTKGKGLRYAAWRGNRTVHTYAYNLSAKTGGKGGKGGKSAGHGVDQHYPQGGNGASQGGNEASGPEGRYAASDDSGRDSNGAGQGPVSGSQTDPANQQCPIFPMEHSDAPGQAPADDYESWLTGAVTGAMCLPTLEACRAAWDAAGRAIGQDRADLRALIQARAAELQDGSEFIPGDDQVAVCPGCSLPLPDGEGLTVDGYHVCCTPVEEPKPAPETEPEAPAATPPGDDHGQAPEPAQMRSEPRAAVSDAEELAHFTNAVRKVDADATDADIAAGLNIFHEVTGGVRWVSYAGQVGQAWFSMLAARHASIRRPEALTSPVLAEITDTAPLTRINFVARPKAAIKVGRDFVTSYDANGQYPAAAGSADLGDGEPVTIVSPRSIDGLVSLPGYVKLAAQLRTGHPAFDTIPAGRWVAMPLVKFLVTDLGLTVPAEQVVYWPKHGRRLSAYISRYRAARERLMSAAQTGPVRVALIGLKSQANVFISMFNSEIYSHGGFYRPDWNHMIVATAEANALRHFWGLRAKCKVAPVAKQADAVYFVAGKDKFVPAGLEISDPLRPEPGKPIGQLGKWKPDRHGPVTDELIRALRETHPSPIRVRDEVIRIDAERRSAV